MRRLAGSMRFEAASERRCDAIGDLGARPKLMETGLALVESDVENLDGHFVLYIFGRDVTEVGKNADPFFEFDQGDEIAFVEHGKRWVHGLDPGVDPSAPGEGDGLPLE